MLILFCVALIIVINSAGMRAAISHRRADLYGSIVIVLAVLSLVVRTL